MHKLITHWERNSSNHVQADVALTSKNSNWHQGIDGFLVTQVNLFFKLQESSRIRKTAESWDAEKDNHNLLWLSSTASKYSALSF